MPTITSQTRAGEGQPSKGTPALVTGGLGSFRPSRQGHWGWVASLFLVTLGAKLWLIHRSGTSLPFWDQWNGQGISVFLPCLQHRLSFANLLAPHNEHRIFFTRLYDLGLL